MIYKVTNRSRTVMNQSTTKRRWPHISPGSCVIVPSQRLRLPGLECGEGRSLRSDALTSRLRGRRAAKCTPSRQTLRADTCHRCEAHTQRDASDRGSARRRSRGRRRRSRSRRPLLALADETVRTGNALGQLGTVTRRFGLVVGSFLSDRERRLHSGLWESQASVPQHRGAPLLPKRPAQTRSFPVFVGTYRLIKSFSAQANLTKYE